MTTSSPDLLDTSASLLEQAVASGQVSPDRIAAHEAAHEAAGELNASSDEPVIAEESIEISAKDTLGSFLQTAVTRMAANQANSMEFGLNVGDSTVVFELRVVSVDTVSAPTAG